MCKVIFGLLIRRHQRFFQVANRSRLAMFHLCLRRAARVRNLVTFRNLVISNIKTQQNLFRPRADVRRNDSCKFLNLPYFHSLMLIHLMMRFLSLSFLLLKFISIITNFSPQCSFHFLVLCHRI